MLIAIGLIWAVSLVVLLAVLLNDPDKYDIWGNRR